MAGLPREWVAIPHELVDERLCSERIVDRDSVDRRIGILQRAVEDQIERMSVLRIEEERLMERLDEVELDVRRLGRTALVGGGAFILVMGAMIATMLVPGRAGSVLAPISLVLAGWGAIVVTADLLESIRRRRRQSKESKDAQ